MLSWQVLYVTVFSATLTLVILTTILRYDPFKTQIQLINRAFNYIIETEIIILLKYKETVIDYNQAFSLMCKGNAQ